MQPLQSRRVAGATWVPVSIFLVAIFVSVAVFVKKQSVHANAPIPLPATQHANPHALPSGVIADIPALTGKSPEELAAALGPGNDTTNEKSIQDAQDNPDSPKRIDQMIDYKSQQVNVDFFQHQAEEFILTVDGPHTATQMLALGNITLNTKPSEGNGATTAEAWHNVVVGGVHYSEIMLVANKPGVYSYLAVTTNNNSSP